MVWTSGPEETEGQHLVSTSVHISWAEVHKIPWGTVLRESPLLTGMVMLTEWPDISPPVATLRRKLPADERGRPPAVHTPALPPLDEGLDEGGIALRSSQVQEGHPAEGL